MRIGLISDLHCNVVAVEAALDALGPLDELWCAGDIVNESRFSNETVALLRERDARCVFGNHDAVLLSPAGTRARTAAHVDSDHVAYLGALPRFHEVVVDGRRIVMTHSTPFPPYQEYIWPHSPSLPRMADVEADILILGHTHQPMATQVGGVLVVNPGSAGHATNIARGRAYSCAALDTATGEVEFVTYQAPMP